MVEVRWEHLNREYSHLTQAQAIFLDGHFVIEHTARNRSGRFFNFNGTAGVWRRATIEDCRRMAARHADEDRTSATAAQLAGWRFVYLPEGRLTAEVPVEMNASSPSNTVGPRAASRRRASCCADPAGDLSWAVKVEAFFHSARTSRIR